MVRFTAYHDGASAKHNIVGLPSHTRDVTTKLSTNGEARISVAVATYVGEGRCDRRCSTGGIWGQALPKEDSLS